MKHDTQVASPASQQCLHDVPISTVGCYFYPLLQDGQHFCRLYNYTQAMIAGADTLAESILKQNKTKQKQKQKQKQNWKIIYFPVVLIIK